jgi:hypothetical protein
MKIIRVIVTEEDILQGKPHKSSCCPIALALRRIPHVVLAAGHCPRVFHDEASIQLEDWPFPEGSMLPVRAQDFIDDFDAGDPVEPFIFNLEFDE